MTINDILAKVLILVLGMFGGYYLSLLKERHSAKKLREAERDYLAIHLGVVLDKLILHCVAVANDNGRRDPTTGIMEPVINEIEFDPHKINVNYKCLPYATLLMIFRLPAKIELLSADLREAWWHADAPDNEILFEARIDEYSKFGLELIDLKVKLFALSKATDNPNFDDKHITLFKRAMAEVKSLRDESRRQSMEAINTMSKASVDNSKLGYRSFDEPMKYGVSKYNEK